MAAERNLEIYLVEQVKKVGGRAYKFVSPGYAGVPDRICVFPGGKIVFVELKADETKKPTPLQQCQMNKLLQLGCEVHLIGSREKVNQLINFYGGADRDF